MVILSPDELSLVTNEHLMLAKNRIIQTVVDYFGSLSGFYEDHLNFLKLKELAPVHAKISKGENYKGLPYVMLDYPRQFSKEGSLAIRSFFWWGRYFSITLHISGKYMEHYKEELKKVVEYKYFSDWYLSTGGNEWEHDVMNKVYTQFSDNSTVFIREGEYFKMAKKIPLQEWDNVDEFFKSNFKEILSILRGYAPIL